MHRQQDLNVLCFEHHVEMRPTQVLLKIGAESQQLPAYVCQEPGCFVRYSTTSGYFVAAEDGTRVEGELTPRVSCPEEDGRPMYLAEVRPEQRNYRRWRCPDCGKSLTNEELSQASSE
jgi:hypothetical protein